MFLEELIDHLQKAIDEKCLYVQLPICFVEEILNKLKNQETELCDRCGRVRLKSSRIAEGR